MPGIGHAHALWNENPLTTFERVAQALPLTLSLIRRLPFFTSFEEPISILPEMRNVSSTIFSPGDYQSPL
jgi:hypothetical protein